MKYIRSSIVNSAQTAAVDAGVLSPEFADHRLRLGASLSNLGGALKYDQTADNLPLALRAGELYRANSRWLTTWDVGLPRDNGPYLAAGTEYRWLVRDWNVAGRLGYNSQTLNDVSGLSGLSLGLGIGSKGFGFDYAFIPYGGLGITNRFSISAKW